MGVGIVRYQPSAARGEEEEDEYVILSNPRKTFIPPPGHGFLPRDTAWHHQQVREEEGGRFNSIGLASVRTRLPKDWG